MEFIESSKKNSVDSNYFSKLNVKNYKGGLLKKIPSVKKILKPQKKLSVKKILKPKKIPSDKKVLKPKKIPSDKKVLKPKKIPSDKKVLKPKEKKRTPGDFIYLDNVETSVLDSKVEQIYKKNIHVSTSKTLISQDEKNKIVINSKEYILNVCEAPIDKYSIYYTSGEIESNIIILCCAVNAYKKIKKTKPHVAISAVDHSSILIYAKSLEDSDQIELSIIKPNSYGCILSDSVLQVLKSNTCFVSISYINRELGSVNNIEKISAILHDKKIPLHCDCTHIFGKHKLDLTKTNIDTATISFDKINGPPGVGALIISNDLLNGYKLYEHSSTLSGKRNENIPAIIASVAAIKICLENRKDKNIKLLKLRNEIIRKIGEDCQTMTFANFMKSDEPPLDSLADTNNTKTQKINTKTKIIILGPPPDNESYFTPSIISIIILNEKNITGAIIKDKLELEGIIIGVPEIEKNIMYQEMGLPEASLKYIIRISLDDSITHDNIEKFITQLKYIIF